MAKFKIQLGVRVMRLAVIAERADNPTPDFNRGLPSAYPIGSRFTNPHQKFPIDPGSIKEPREGGGPLPNGRPQYFVRWMIPRDHREVAQMMLKNRPQDKPLIAQLIKHIQNPKSFDVIAMVAEAGEKIVGYIVYKLATGNKGRYVDVMFMGAIDKAIEEPVMEALLHRLMVKSLESTGRQRVDIWLPADKLKMRQFLAQYGYELAGRDPSTGDVIYSYHQHTMDPDVTLPKALPKTHQDAELTVSDIDDDDDDPVDPHLFDDDEPETY